jgi:hypothetical protein
MINETEPRRTVSATQMEALFYFLKSRNIKHYDVQCELADHIANAIEQTWEQNPDISFADALPPEEEKFGGKFGFMKIMFKRQAALRKRYRKMFWGYFFSYFKLPQIIGVVAFGYGLFRLMSWWYKSYLLVLVPLIIAIVLRERHLNKVYKSNPHGHHWLMEEMIYARDGGVGYLVMCVNFTWQMWRDDYPFGLIVTESVVITLLALYGYVKLMVIPNRAEAYLKEIYPEYGK